jgi:adenylate cyclase
MSTRLKNDSKLLEPSRRTLTIVFWDIRNFSGLTDQLRAHPELIAGFLREYFEEAAKIIFKHEGVLDKFIGDGVMALFGVLNQSQDKGVNDAISAAKAARDFRIEFENIKERWIKEWRMSVTNEMSQIGLGCGINTGEVIAGNVGPSFRHQFTALGDAVNFASRLQSDAKRGEIVISQSTQARIGSAMHTEERGIISVKNKPGNFPTWRIP